MANCVRALAYQAGVMKLTVETSDIIAYETVLFGCHLDLCV
jgi:hypothetical protein